ncbi:substrate-binding periplasmic protein [Silvanigrella aquatica]|uniref:Solute-binding protein family 3/N-terminal domain-containing protein n=1 Tax=Silvanigrella aquatica TaxID=1915309 RepID=A0A1L4D0W5_9BACT|nr:transporter substrate-binding domain-containing protein [Silvanigrella aquatica]APJ03820.1 hypothetical protein AXG55_07840 [Silvanigrella aquatica]
MIKKISLIIKCILCFVFLLNSLYVYSIEPDIKVIKIAYYKDFPPLSFIENDVTIGVFIDISELVLGKMMGYKVIQEAFPWERAQDYVRRGEFDAHLTVSTKEREKYLLFQKNITYEGPIVMAYSKYNSKIKEIENIKKISDFENFNLMDYIGNGWGKEYLFNKKSMVNNVYFSPNLINALKMINANRADIIPGILAYNAQYIIKHENLNNIKIKEINLGKSFKNIFKLCIRKNFPNAKKILKKYDEKYKIALKNGDISKILSKKKYTFNN